LTSWIRQGICNCLNCGLGSATIWLESNRAICLGTSCTVLLTLHPWGCSSICWCSVGCDDWDGGTVCLRLIRRGYRDRWVPNTNSRVWSCRIQGLWCRFSWGRLSRHRLWNIRCPVCCANSNSGLIRLSRRIDLSIICIGWNLSYGLGGVKRSYRNHCRCILSTGCRFCLICDDRE
jgi:hypothetical protein